MVKGYSMKIRNCLLLLFLGLYFQSVAQKEAYNWYFGQHAALNFSSGAPVSLAGSAMVAPNGCTSISDSAGNLLFYSNGKEVWNRNHMQMQNGYGLNGQEFAPQSALALKAPGSDSRYYLFTIGGGASDQYGAFYTTIDMLLDDGLGSVLPWQKNIPLVGADSVKDALGAIAFGDKEGYWVFVRSFTVQNKILAYLVDETGVHQQPVVSPGIYNSSINVGSGTVKVSPDGRYLIYSPSQWVWNLPMTELYALNSYTGEATPVFRFDSGGVNWGAEFSANSEFLYLTPALSDSSYIVQFDMSQLSSAQAFQASRYVVHSVKGSREPSFYQCQLAPDGKIYISRFSFGFSGFTYLPAINEPSKKGVLCDFEPHAVDLIEGNCYMGLPAFVQSYLVRYSFSGQCVGSETTFTSQFNPVPDSIEWEFDDPATGTLNFSNELNPVHLFSNTGTYHVRATAFYLNGHQEQAIREIKIYALPVVDLGIDHTICPGEQVTLDAGYGFESYIWNTGQQGQSIIVSDTGTYCVEVTSAMGCANTDCVIVNRHVAPLINEDNLNLAPTTCGGSTGAITGLEITGTTELTFQWKDGSDQSFGSNLDINHLPVENYVLYITDGNGCTWPSRNYTIVDVGDVLIDTVFFSNAHCNQPDGTITVRATTGLAALLVYSIDNGATYYDNLGEFSGLLASEYKVKVKINDPLQPCQKVYDYNPVQISNIRGPQILDVSTQFETGNNSDGKIMIIAEGSGDTLIYSVGGIEQINNGTFTDLQANTYTCIVSDQYGCDTTFEATVEKLTGIRLKAIVADGSACLGNIAVTPLLVQNFNDVSSFNVNLKYDNSTVECLNYLNPNQLLGDSIEINLYQATGELNLKWSGTKPVNLPDGAILLELSFVSKNTGQSPVQWDMAPGQSEFLDSQHNALQSVLQHGQIRIYSIPAADVVDTVTVCEGDNIDLIAYHQPGTGNGTITYEWQGPDSFTSNQPGVFINQAGTNHAGDYIVSISDTNNCRMDYPVRINVVQKPEVNLIDTIYFNGETTLEVAQDYASYQWSTGDSIYYITVTEEGEYSVIIQTEEGCESRDTAMLVNVAVPIQVPNAFTPNGDGLNDTFKPIITRPDLVVNYHLSIYNRWGECFLETRDTAKGWDGKDAPAGVYSWVISYSDIVGKVVKMRGSVTLVK